MRPTGDLHLGHLLGVVDQWVKYGEEADAFLEIADLHALTTGFTDPQAIRDARYEMVAVWLAAGVDPAKTTIFLQSAVPEISELHTLLSMIVPVSWLERVPTFKSQIDALGGEIATYGFLGYPLLQTLRHRDRSRRARAGGTGSGGAFGAGPRSRAPLQPSVRRRRGDSGGAARGALQIPRGFGDGRPQDEQVVRQRDLHFRRRRDHREEGPRHGYRPAQTAPRRPRPSRSLPAFRALEIRGSHRLDGIAAGCRTGELGCVADKAAFAEELNGYLRPVRERLALYRSDMARVERIVAEGTERTREVASGVLRDVRRAMRLT